MLRFNRALFAASLLLLAMPFSACSCNAGSSDLLRGDGSTGGQRDGEPRDASAADSAATTDASASLDTGVLGADAGASDGTSRDAEPPYDGALQCPAPPPPPPSQPPACGPASCGDNHVDTCQTCTPGPCCPGGGGAPCCRGEIVCPAMDAGIDGDAGPGDAGPDDAGMCCTSMTEVCDGTDLAGMSCGSLGYTGGALACNSSCSFDTSGCTVCETSSQIRSCGVPQVLGEAPVSIAIAAEIMTTLPDRDPDIGLAWITSGPNPPDAALHFALLASDLTVISERPCFDLSKPRRVAMAEIPNGWLLAVAWNAGQAPQYIADTIDVLVLDFEGNLRSRRTIANANTPYLAERPGSGPLLLFADVTGAQAIHAELLDVNGVAQWEAMPFTATVEPEYGSAVATSSGFLVAMRVFNQVEVVSLDNQGNVGTPRSPTDVDTEYPQLAWTGTEARLTWSSFHGAPFVGWARLDASGARLGGTSEFTMGFYGYAPQLGLGTDSLVIMPGDTSRTGAASQLQVLRIDQSGNAASGTLIVKDPNYLTQYRIALAGGRAILAWLDEGIGLYPEPVARGRLGLASVTP